MCILFPVNQLGYAVYNKHNADKKKSSIDKYVSDFYTGGRGLGAVVVAMMVAAGIAGAGIFMGMPGLGWTTGQVYIVVTVFSLVMNFSVLGQIGKKVGIVARRANITSYLGIYRDRYEHNKAYSYLIAAVCVFFLGIYTASTYAGGAKLFQAMTGQSYTIGLVVFTVVILVSSLLGGIGGIGKILVIQGAVMTASIIAFFFLGINSVGGLENMYRSMITDYPAWFSLSNYGWLQSFGAAFTLCFVIWSLPHAAVSTIAYKNTKSLHGAIKVGLVIVFIWSIGLNLLIPVVKYTFPNLTDYVSADLGIPYLVIKNHAGLGRRSYSCRRVCAAVQSSLNTMALTMCSMVVTDTFSVARPNTKPETMKKVNITVTIVVSCILFYFAFDPPPLLSIVALYAMGGLATGFVPELIIGMYWPRGNVSGRHRRYHCRHRRFRPYAERLSRHLVADQGRSIRPSYERHLLYRRFAHHAKTHLRDCEKMVLRGLLYRINSRANSYT
jgi:sodium/pantothenate symporter